VVWTHQGSALTVGTDAGSTDLFPMTIRQLHGDVLYHFNAANARLRPFVFGGVGATFFSADDLESETKFSFGLGAGVKYFGHGGAGSRPAPSTPRRNAMTACQHRPTVALRVPMRNHRRSARSAVMVSIHNPTPRAGDS